MSDASEPDQQVVTGEETDPTRATGPGLSRRAFSLLSGAAATLGATGAAPGADAFGRPHPPLVAEDDPALVIGRPALTHGSRSLGAYAAGPRDPAAGGVVVVQAIWGVDAQLRDTVRRLAAAGYAAVAPDLYSGLAAPSGDGATDFAPYRDVAATLVDATVDADLAAAAAYLRAGSPRRRVGIVGFCMGGGIALRQALHAETFDAAEIFYGKVPAAPDFADALAVPLAGSWGERDTSIPAADVRALDAALTARRRPHDIKIYSEAGHAFFDDTRASYVASAAGGAWTRTLDWFTPHLR